MSKYDEFFQGEEYQFGTSVEDIRSQNLDYINTIEKDDPSKSFFSFGTQAPTLTELLNNPDYISKVLDPMLSDVIGHDNQDRGLFGNTEGYGIPESASALEGDLKKYYGGGNSWQDKTKRITDFYEDLGETPPYFSQHAFKNASFEDTYYQNMYINLFKNEEDALRTSYKLLGNRMGGAKSPFAGTQTYVDGIEGRMGAVDAAEAKFDQSADEVEMAGAGYGDIKRQSNVMFSGSGLASSGVAENVLQKLDDTYKKEIDKFRNNRALNWSNIASTMKGFSTADKREIDQFYSVVGEDLAAQDLAFTEELG